MPSPAGPAGNALRNIPVRRSYARGYEQNRSLGALLPQDGLQYVTELKGGEALRADIVLHISCNAHYTLFIPYIAQEILKRLGKSHVVFGGPESCCGSRQFNMGNPDLEAQNAKLAQLSFSRVKPQLLVSVCPDCDEVFEKFRLPTTGYEIANFSALLPRFLDELRPLLRPVERRVVVHHHTSDPARIADGMNMRAVLEAIPGLQVVHMEDRFGPGIHCQTIKPMPADDQARMFDQAIALGADTIAMPYHSCYRQHLKMELLHPVRVQHYLGLVAESLGIAYDEPLKKLRLLDDLDASMAMLRPAIEQRGWDEAMVRSFVQNAVYL